MKPDLPPGAFEALQRFMNACGIKPMRRGSVEIHFSEDGMTVREQRQTNYTLAPERRSAQNTGT